MESFIYTFAPVAGDRGNVSISNAGRTITFRLGIRTTTVALNVSMIERSETVSARDAYVIMLHVMSGAYKDEKMTWGNLQESVSNMYEALLHYESKQPKE